MFQFMAKNLGIEVLHPGGLSATNLLAERCGISEDMTILDAGCGSGKSSIFLAKQYGCRVIGIDIDRDLLLKAQTTAHKNRVDHQVAFRLADINDLPFQDQTFDGAIFQAALIFTEKSRTLQAVSKKIRSQGFAGAIELAWKTDPPQNVVRNVRNVLCSAVVNAEQHANWIELLNKNGFNVVDTELRDLDFNFRGMLENEGLLSTLKVALKCTINKEAKNKIADVTTLFKETREYLGYGIYVGRKGQVDRSATQHQNSRALGYASN